ncbi:hypothetical protein HYH03_005695 [Edaphochlamys debaryana]|uniref:Uncharacterized protein n=1 Tax=Edaphochlamys debaryana TaxID=47281 RepID=A0A836C1P9_9CHLO|nr:hypothetical protein HYH03_005695 [Edaphochlamys debaryana]|eukprot:KAG2496092.1 hypothetical protein HYH03_005695 [Edaphochlamys debaryana]
MRGRRTSLRGVRKLLRYGTPPTVRNAAGRTPLHLALEGGRLKAARILLEKGVALRAEAKKPPPELINIPDARKVTPLLSVVAAGRLRLCKEVLKMCKELGVSVDYDTKDSQGNTLLHYAAKWGWLDELAEWMNRTTRPNKLLNCQNKEGETPLGHLLRLTASGLPAAKAKAPSLVSRMLELGALAKLPAFREKVPPICLAAATNDKGLYDMLIAKGAKPTGAKDALGRTALHYAASKGCKSIGEDLLNQGLKAYALDSQKNTPLHLAASKGQEDMVSLLLDKADDKFKALLTPNRQGLGAYHLALKAGPGDKAQASSLALIQLLGPRATEPILGRKKAVVDTPLMLAIQGHQEKVVRTLMGEMAMSPNDGNVKGELPLARVLSCATAVTYDNDSSIFDQLVAAGADMDRAGPTQHPLLAICKNALSKFAEKAVGVLTERCGPLSWDRRDDKGYTPLALAAFFDNAWLIRHLIDDVGVDPNADAQRSQPTEPEVVGTTGALCCTKVLTAPGTVAGQTPLMCAAKGASVATLQLLLNRGADVNAVDSQGRSSLQHAMHLDRAASIKVAASLLQAGARPERGIQSETGAWKQCFDLVGESWPHRAVRYGASKFLELWAGCGGSLELLASTADDADDMPGAELKVEDKGDFLDFAPMRRVENAVEEEDEELLDDANEDSEKAADEDDIEGDGGGGGPAGAVAEGREDGAGADSDDDCGSDVDAEVAALVAAGEVESHYPGPTPTQLLRWDEFWVEDDSLPDSDVEGDPDWADRYDICDEGDHWIDEEDVEDEIWAALRDEQRQAAAAVRADPAAFAGMGEGPAFAPYGSQSPARGAAGASTDSPDAAPPSPSMIHRVSSGLAHRLFKHRLPNAMVPPEEPQDADANTFAAGSPSKWLRRKSSSSSLPGSPSASARALGVPAGPFGSPAAAPAPSAPTAPSGPSPSARRGLGGTFARGTQVRPAGPVAEAFEDDEDDDAMADLARNRPPSGGSGAGSGSGSARGGGGGVVRAGSAGSNGSRDLRTGDSRDQEEGGGGVDLIQVLQSKQQEKMGAAVSKMNMVASKSYAALNAKAGSLISGTKGEVLWANEPYYQPATRYNDLPAYMKVDTEPLPDAVYAKHEAAFDARVEELLVTKPIKEDKRLEGADLRARNIDWYLKSMSPIEYPLKIGKWKSFAKMSKKAILAARLRRPCKPGEKPKIRKKTAWFGLPDLPTRPELALTSPLAYAVRLCRPKCVEVLTRLSGALPNLPDAHGVTPLSYALFLLAKERHNKSLQSIVDLLLAARPLVDTATVWNLVLKKRMAKDLAWAEADAAAKGGVEKLPRAQRKALKEQQQLYGYLKDNYSARDFPSVMEPLVLATLLNDVGRLTVLVRRCGANLNNAWVFLPDIPTYFQGLWEKQLGKCHSRVTPLHVGICQKKYDTVKSLLDLGCDPNLTGSEYSGNIHKDLQRAAKLIKSKMSDARALKATGKGANPYAKLWSSVPTSLMGVLVGMKKFISSIEIPGLTKPHPWLSPLHLACRFGLASISFMLIRRGAALNGGPAAAVAPKSPLEEALAYARANCQAYGTTSERFNFNYILEQACVQEMEGNREVIAQALQDHAAEIDEWMRKIRAKAEAIQAKGSGKDKKSVEQIMAAAIALKALGGRLAGFDVDHLKKIPMPGANLFVLADRAKGAYKDALAMMDPIKVSMKAVCAAAKILVKIVVAMMKRPIAHYDPALSCAHVLLYLRAPINLSEKQTSILMRDILDNGNGLPESDSSQSYYRWLGVEPEDVNDSAWIGTVVNEVEVLKCNVECGYIKMDLCTTYKQYSKLCKKFMAAVNNSVLNNGVAGLMPAYLRPVLEEGMRAAGMTKDRAGEALTAWFKAYVDSQAEGARSKLAAYEAAPDKELWANKYNFGDVPAPPDRDAVALSLLPEWLQDAPPAEDEPELEGVLTVPRKEDDIIAFIVKRFLAHDPATQRPRPVLPPPRRPNPWEQMADPEKPDSIAWGWPFIPKEEIDKQRPTIKHLGNADIVMAVLRAYGSVMVSRARALSERLQKESAARAKAAADAFINEQLQGAAAARMGAVSKFLSDLSQPSRFNEGPIFVAALENPMWEAATAKVGSGLRPRVLMSRLRGAAARGLVPRIADPLEFAKGLGERPMDKSPEEALSLMEGQLGADLPPALRSALTQALTMDIDEDEEGSAGEEAEAGAAAGPAAGGRRRGGAVPEGGQDPEASVATVDAEIGPAAAAMVETLQRLVREAAPTEVPSPEDMARDLAAAFVELRDPDALWEVLETKLGTRLPAAVRTEMQQGADQFMERVLAKYESAGRDMSAAIGACTLVTVGVVVAVAVLPDSADRTIEGALEGAGAAAEAAEALGAMAEGDILDLPVREVLEEAADAALARAPLTPALREAQAKLAKLGVDPKAIAKQFVKKLLKDDDEEEDGEDDEEGEGEEGEGGGLVEALGEELAGCVEGVMEGLQGDIGAMADQIGAGIDLDLGVDMASLTEGLDALSEVLTDILDMLGIEDA